MQIETIKRHYKEYVEQVARFERFAYGIETGADKEWYKGNDLLFLERFLWGVREQVLIRPKWSLAVERDDRWVEWKLSVSEHLHLQGEGILVPSSTHPSIGEVYLVRGDTGEREKTKDYWLHKALCFVFGVFIKQPPQLTPCTYKDDYLVENAKAVLKHRFPNHKFKVWKDCGELRVAHESRLSCWAVSEALEPFRWNSWGPPDIGPFAKMYGNTPNILTGTFEELEGKQGGIKWLSTK